WGSQPCKHFTPFIWMTPIHISHLVYGETDLCGRILSNHSLPFFRTSRLVPFRQFRSDASGTDAMGVVSLAWAVCQNLALYLIHLTVRMQTMTGVTLSNFAPKEPPIVATSENLFKSAVACRARLIFCVPTFLEVCMAHGSTETKRNHRVIRNGRKIPIRFAS